MKNIILVFLAIFFILIITPIINKNRYIVEGASGMIVPVKNTTFQTIYEDFTTIKSINYEWYYPEQNFNSNTTYGFEPRWNSKSVYPNSLFTTNNNTWYLSSKNTVIYATLNNNTDIFGIENSYYYKTTPMKYLKTNSRVFNLFYWRASYRVTPIGHFYTNINITTQGTYSVSFATSFHDKGPGGDIGYFNLKVALGSSYIIFNNANVYYVSSGNVSISAYSVNSSGTSEVSKLLKDNPAINALIGSLGFITLTFTNIPVGTSKLSFGADTLYNDNHFCGFGISQIEVSHISTSDPPVYAAIQSYLKLRNTNQSVAKDAKILQMIRNLSPYGGDSILSQKVSTVMTSDNTNEVFKNLGSLFNINNNAFTPLSITERGGCTNWYDGADPNGDGTIPSNGTTINTWVDKSSHKNNMIAQTTGGKYVTNSQNALGAVLFSNTWYRTVSTRASYPIDVFVVVKLDSLTTPVDVIGYGSKSNDTFNSLTYGEYTASKWHNGSSNFFRTPNALANSTETSKGYLLMEWSVGNNNFYIIRNGSAIMHTNTYTWTPPSDNELRLGNRIFFAANNLLQGSIAEVIVYDFQLYHYDRFKVEGYLAWKWGLNTLLPTDHPYYSVSI